MTPFDYVSAFQQQGGGGLGGFAQAFQVGSQIAAANAQRAQAQAQAQAQQMAVDRQRQVGEAMSALMGNKSRTFADYEAVASMLPEKEAASLRSNFEALTKERQASDLAFSGQVLAAFGSKSPQIGVELLRERAAGERNAGREDQAKAFETWATLAETDPESAAATIGVLVSSLPGGDKVIEGVGKAQEQQREKIRFPVEMVKNQAEAQTAAVAAKYAESKAVQELAEKGWNIAKLQNDIDVAKQNVKIAAMQASLAREGNDLKRKELDAKLQEAKDKRDSTIREKAADLESARFNVDNMLNTAARILKTPMGVVGSAAGPVSARIPTTFQSTADFEELVNTLGSQSFLAQIPNIKGMGALSNAEGEKLQAALQNFSLRQSPERLLENVKEADRLLRKARKNMTDRAGLPESAPDMPAQGGPEIPTAAPAPAMPIGFRVIPN